MYLFVPLPIKELFILQTITHQNLKNTLDRRIDVYFEEQNEYREALKRCTVKKQNLQFNEEYITFLNDCCPPRNILKYLANCVIG